MGKQFLLFAFTAISVAGCSTAPRRVNPIISNYVGTTDFAKYKNIAVLPFTDAPNAPYSGQIVQGVVGQALAKTGFKVVERARLQEALKEQWLSASGVLTTPKTVELGKILGVSALVMGEVGQYETRDRKTDTTYFPFTNYVTGQTTYIPRQGQQWMENYVSISLRIIDVETALLVYSGSGQFPVGLINPPQQLAEVLAYEILGRWTVSPGVCGYNFDNSGVITEVIKDLPAGKAGLQVGDKLLQVNGKDLNLSEPLEVSSLTWGEPGSKIALSIDRKGIRHQLNITRVPRE